MIATSCRIGAEKRRDPIQRECHPIRAAFFFADQRQKLHPAFPCRVRKDPRMELVIVRESSFSTPRALPCRDAGPQSRRRPPWGWILS
ncbi:MAG: hypothetical protein MZV64_34400 [Ignavibacteriales bacterium]|nr:hypothetical protein [Ignavibacteriales bacterium]